MKDKDEFVNDKRFIELETSIKKDYVREFPEMDVKLLENRG